MTLARSGPVSINDMAVELAVAQAGVNLNDAYVRKLANKPGSGPISFTDFYGKSFYQLTMQANPTYTGVTYQPDRGLGSIYPRNTFEGYAGSGSYIYICSTD